MRSLEYRFATKAGEWRYLGSTANLIVDNMGNPNSFLVVSRDITERKKVSEELERHRDQLMREIEEHKRTEEELRLYHDKLRSVSSELFLTEERERRQIASDLHDRIGQSLAMSKIALGALRQSVSSSELAEAVDKIHRLIEQTIQDTRTLTFEISPPVLYELGLEAALEWLVKQFRIQYNLRIRLDNDGQPKPVDESLRVIIFRAIRELLVNITKHARAQNIEVSIRRDGGNINITVQDDGIGFDGSQIDYNKDETKGFGLFSIRDRLSHLGGHLDIESQPGKGTRVTLVSPLRHDDEAKEERAT
jgi:signal transduction histidine kinase